MKEFVSLTIVAMEIGKRNFSVNIAMVATGKTFFIRNINLVDTNCHWVYWVDCRSARRDGMSQPQKCTSSGKVLKR